MTSVVASRPDDVTVDFLNEVLARRDAHITAAEYEAFGTGQIATTLRVSLTWSSEDVNLPTHVIVKLAGIDPGRREASRRQATFRREVSFYRDLAPQLTISTPGCLYAADHAASASMTIVLHEVVGRRGNQLTGCGVLDAEAVVESAVQLHSPFWGHPELLAPLDWLAPDGPEAAAAWDRRMACMDLPVGELERAGLARALEEAVLDEPAGRLALHESGGAGVADSVEAGLERGRKLDSRIEGRGLVETGKLGVGGAGRGGQGQDVHVEEPVEAHRRRAEPAGGGTLERRWRSGGLQQEGGEQDHA